jgi:hypothetical protein
MNPNPLTLRRTFAKPTALLVRISPKGFLILDELSRELTGRIGKTHLVRKLFEDGVLICDSKDGRRARNGTLCPECRHPQCRPLLRIHLHWETVVYILDLAFTSAQNLLALETEALEERLQLSQWTLRLTVRDHGYWGEVLFERVG